MSARAARPYFARFSASSRAPYEPRRSAPRREGEAVDERGRDGDPAEHRARRDTELLRRRGHRAAPLERRGYLPAHVEDVEGVRRFQRDAGLVDDGLLGNLGLAKLEPQRKGVAPT